MSPAPATPRSRSLLGYAYWAIPPLFAIWFYWLGIRTWFIGDDFVWLTHANEFTNFREFLHAVFMPMAQGTIRPWSDRLFFMAFYRVFGLNPLPFHIAIFLTQCANILLLLAIVPRLTGSRAAGFVASLLWIVNVSQPMLMTWTAAYSQPLCALFVLGAFYLLLRYLETGRRRYWVLQWIVFLLGFGALELNMMYPALAAAYTLLCARKYFLRTLPLFAASIAFVIAHRMAAGITGSVYQMHFGGATLLNTLVTYWNWTLGPAFLASMIPLASWKTIGSTVLLTVALLGAVAWSARKREFLPLFFLAWFLILIAPVLPLSDHVTEYYPFLPSAGLAMLGGWAMVRAFRSPLPWKAAALALAGIYAWCSVYAVQRATRWEFERARNVRKLVLGVARAHELHPGKVILLDGMDDPLFWTTVIDHPFPLVGANFVYLTPGTEKQIVPHPELGDPMEFVIPPGPAWHSVAYEEAVVYSVRDERIRNITSLYSKAMAPEWQYLKAQRVDAANPVDAYLLGPEWYGIDINHRWMARRASVQLAGPHSRKGRLHVFGIAGPAATRMTISIDGARLQESPLVSNESFDIEMAAPPAVVGKPAVEVVIDVDRTFTSSALGRELGLAFGIIEFRE